MRTLRHLVIAVSIVLGVSTAAAVGQPAGMVDVAPLEALAQRSGLRVLASKYLVLATDRPARAGDGIDDLPRIFDEAVAAWCRHFRIEPASIEAWRSFGCLVVDRERFREAGLLPDTIPEFTNGFCDRNRFWMLDQSNPAYRRHLLLHEGAHAFTLTVRGLATPVWYNEGIAEYLATHRLDGDPAAFVATPIPDRASDVEQLGRIEQLRDLREAGRSPSLADVLGAAAGRHHAIADYAASWAAVALFARHPTYAAAFAALERGPLAPDFNDRLAAMPGFDPARASRDFDAFTADIDYGYDFDRSAIDWSPGRPVAGTAEIRVAAGRGWQNSGIAVAKGSRHDIRARGRCTLGRIGETLIETEADGISLDWYRGRPLGRLLVAQWVESPPDGGRPRFVVLGDGATATITAAVDGPLYLELNEPPGSLADDSGAVTVDLAPAPDAP